MQVWHLRKEREKEDGLGRDSLRPQCGLVRPQGVARPLGQPEAPVSRLSLEGTSEWHTSLADMVASEPLQKSDSECQSAGKKASQHACHITSVFPKWGQFCHLGDI